MRSCLFREGATIGRRREDSGGRSTCPAHRTRIVGSCAARASVARRVCCPALLLLDAWSAFCRNRIESHQARVKAESTGLERSNPTRDEGRNGAEPWSGRSCGGEGRADEGGQRDRRVRDGWAVGEGEDEGVGVGEGEGEGVGVGVGMGWETKGLKTELDLEWLIKVANMIMGQGRTKPCRPCSPGTLAEQLWGMDDGCWGVVGQATWNSVGMVLRTALHSLNVCL